MRAAFVAIALAGCVTDKPAAVPPSTTKTYELADEYAGGAGCFDIGDELTLDGQLLVRPFGKGTDGAVLKTAGGEWILSYRAEGPLLDLRDQRVRARGRECEKEGEAIYGRHFKARTIGAVP